MARLDNGAVEHVKLLWIKQSHYIVCACICLWVIRHLHNKAAVALQSAYKLRGVGTWLFNQGHLAHLLFFPQPAFHPAPGEQGDRWGTIHSLQGFTRKWPHTQSNTRTHIWRWWRVMHDCEDAKGQTGILTVVTPPVLFSSFLALYLSSCACVCAYMSVHVSVHLY